MTGKKKRQLCIYTISSRKTGTGVLPSPKQLCLCSLRFTLSTIGHLSLLKCQELLYTTSPGPFSHKFVASVFPRHMGHMNFDPNPERRLVENTQGKNFLFSLLSRTKAKKGKHLNNHHLLAKTVLPLNVFPLEFLDLPLCLAPISHVAYEPKCSWPWQSTH